MKEDRKDKLRKLRLDIRRGRRAKFFLWFKIAFLALVVLTPLSFFLYINYWHFDFDEKLIGEFLNYKPLLTTEILDRNGKPLIELEGVEDWSKPVSERTTEYRKWAGYENIPLLMRNAILAAEDQNFWNHNGLDWPAMGRAAWVNFLETMRQFRRTGKLSLVAAEGASTLDQQANELTIISKTNKQKLRADQSFLGKVIAKSDKMRLTVWLLKALTEKIGRETAKKKIFEIVANVSYCGDGRYGVVSAARHIFGKDLEELDPAEAATVASLFRSPGKYSPYRNRMVAIARRNGVLKVMADRGYINSRDLPRWQKSEFQLAKHTSQKTEAPAAVSHILKSLSPDKKSLVWGNGETIKSSIDLETQRMANAAVRKGLDDYKARQLSHVKEATNEEDKQFFLSRVEGVEGAMVVIENKTGMILAMVGAYDAVYQDFNRAVDAMRQPGSAFKPIFYGSALAQGTNVWKIDCLREGEGECRVYDGPGITVSMGRKRNRHHIGNYTGEFFGWIPVWYAVAKSQNSAAMWLARKLGPKTIVEFAHWLGLNKDIEEYPTTALGAEEVTVLELTAAYEVFINGGVYKEPGIVFEVADSDGNVAAPTYEAKPVLAKFVANEIVELLRHTVLYKSGTGRQLNEPGYSVRIAGKTGTTNDYHDAWFCGSNLELTVCGWIGRDDNTPLGTDSQMGIVKNKDQWCSPLHPKKKEYCEAGAKTALPPVKMFFADYYKDKIPPKFPEEMDDWIKYVHEHDKHPKR